MVDICYQLLIPILLEYLDHYTMGILNSMINIINNNSPNLNNNTLKNNNLGQNSINYLTK